MTSIHCVWEPLQILEGRDMTIDDLKREVLKAPSEDAEIEQAWYDEAEWRLMELVELEPVA